MGIHQEKSWNLAYVVNEREKSQPRRTGRQKGESFWYLFIQADLTVTVLHCCSELGNQKGVLDITQTVTDMPFKINRKNTSSVNVLVPPPLILLSLCEIAGSPNWMMK